MNIKRFIKVIVFMSLVVLIGSVLTNILRFRDNHIYKISQYYQDTEDTNFNFFFVGSSHIYSGIDVNTIDGELGVNTYDLSVALCKMSQAFYLLREAIKYDDIDVVAIDMYSLYNKRILNTQQKARVSNSMKWSENKLDYLINVMGFPGIADHFIPLLRYHNNYSEPELIIENLETYGEPLPIPSSYYHGFASSDKEMTENEFKKILKKPSVSGEYYLPTPIDYEEYDKELEYLYKIIELCHENGIEVILLKTPVISYFGSMEQYADYYTCVAEQAGAKYGINTIDYNYLSYALGLDNTYFSSTGHLNKKGASVLSTHFANYYKAIHDPWLNSDENYIINPVLQAVSNRGKSVLTYDKQYGPGISIEKIYNDTDYKKIAVMGSENIKQPGADYLPYTFSCIIKNTGKISEGDLKYIFNIYNGKNGCDRYQYRTMEHLGGDYYRLTVSLESNIGDYIEICANSNLPKGVPVEIYQMELKQDFR